MPAGTFTLAMLRCWRAFLAAPGRRGLPFQLPGTERPLEQRRTSGGNGKVEGSGQQLSPKPELSIQPNEVGLLGR
jgi:hypothetical protein